MCQDFFKKYPEYLISALRISGSAAESLFSQYKYNAGGELDSCNYVTAICAYPVQQCAASHHSGTGSRDHTLSYIQLPLKKKSYGNHNTSQTTSAQSQLLTRGTRNYCCCDYCCCCLQMYC